VEFHGSVCEIPRNSRGGKIHGIPEEIPVPYNIEIIHKKLQYFVKVVGIARGVQVTFKK
jgi:hypothetical protein